jgi:hypothetical protein
MTIIAKVANILLIVFSIYFAAKVENSMRKEVVKISEIIESESYACGSYMVWEISVAVFVAALLNGGKKVLKTGVI